MLRDQLREAFEADPRLQPEDVVVLCPDLETYAPLVQAVFGLTEAGQSEHIPYHVAGRTPRRTRPIVEAYFRVLELLPGRLAASELLDLLHVPPIRDAAGLDSAEVDKLTDWAGESGVRWGADAAHRAAEQLPASDLNTWQFGLDRLLLGYAMPPGGGQLVGDVLALDRAEGLAGDTLGKFWAFVSRVTAWRNRLREPRPLNDWREPLVGLAGELLDTRQDEAGVQRIFDAIDRLVTSGAGGGFQGPLPFSVVLRELTRLVDQLAGGAAFRVGGVTVCEITAVRSLPFAVVALLGINDGVFPRVDRPVGFDLLAHHPRLGDRMLRLEDKQLFLEALLSARTRLIITYQGQNLQDQRLRPPSVVVEELLDALEPYGGEDPSLTLRAGGGAARSSARRSSRGIRCRRSARPTSRAAIRGCSATRRTSYRRRGRCSASRRARRCSSPVRCRRKTHRPNSACGTCSGCWNGRGSCSSSGWASCCRTRPKRPTIASR